MKARNPIIHFEKIDSVNNPNSMHGIYPYRGKISAIDAQNIIRQLPSKGTILDPFCGSGTIVYEGQRHGLKAIGVDNNPLAVQLSKAKIHKEVGNSIEECKYLIEMAKKDFDSKNYEKMPEGPLKSFHEQTASEIMCMKNYYESMNDYLKGVFFGAIALAARGCNGYVWTSSTVGKNIEPKRYINFFEKMLSKAKKHSKYFNPLECEAARIIQGDSRKLSEMIEPHSIDFVFTSPPYFDGLDYTAYYGKLVYEIFGIDRVEVKKNLIQYVDTYEADMRAVIEELEKVTTENALIIFVVGDKKVKGGVINGRDFFRNIREASYVEERSYSGSSSQVFDVLNRTKRKEQIVVWDKYKGEVIKHEF
jgi:16S rRNA G966 N2-methylase RsmD